MLKTQTETAKKQSTYNQVDNNLTERIPKHLQKSSFKGPGNSRGPAAHHNRILEMSNMSATLNNSFELVNSGAGSPRINVHPDEFITDQSFNRYQRHRSPEKSLDDQAWRTLLSRNSNNQQHSLQPPATFTRQGAASTTTTNNKELQAILQSYGIDVDEELLDKSETSNLLDEVDLALIQEGQTMDSIVSVNQSVDWNEVDRILNE